ncbi:MAG: electron transfer flavoprotein, alpha subunit [Clostridia bacterium BRH_c25]|nr:MAG: electron transfer flavoprotein, alpha subunit [Clostridia bacterium BRH_c25]
MDKYAGVLIVAEQDKGEIHKVTSELLNKGKELAGKLKASLECLILAGEGIAAEELNFRGADTVYYMKSEAFEVQEEYLFKSNISEFIKEHKPEIVLVGATDFGRSLAPRVAAALRTGLTADCTEMEIDEAGKLIQIRPAFSDNILAHIRTVTYPQMATIRYKEFCESGRDASKPVNIVEVKPYLDEYDKSRVVRVFSDEEFDITEAEVIVAGGRGIRRKEDLTILEELAEVMGGAVGASRALVDAGMISGAHQVGYSGNRVKPGIYVACGISGAPQHLAGMKESDVIIAINSDPSAPIFNVCDFGYVGDLYEIVPELIRAVRRG